MKAIGVSPWHVFNLIAVESFLQISIASLLALSAGLPLSFYSETHPLDLTFLASDTATVAGIAFDPYWYTEVTLNSVIMPILVMAIIGMLAVLYPAGKAAMIRPLEAIYHR